MKRICESLGALLFLGACAGADVRVETAGLDRARFATFTSFSVVTAADAPPTGYAAGNATPDVLALATNDVAAELSRRGYQRNDQSSDLIVRVAAGSRTVLESPTGSQARLGVPVMKDTERAIVIDVIARSTSESVFHGVARYDAARDADPSKVHETISKIVAEIPSASKAP